MKVQLTIVLALFLASSVFATNGNPISGEPSLISNPTNTSFTLHNIFFNDVANSVLFIDFEAVIDQIVEVNILRDDTLMMEDDVSDLSSNTIYEINLEIIREGNYTIELVTAEGIVVHKDIWVE